MEFNASTWHVYAYTHLGVKKVKKQDEVKETTEALVGEEQQSDETQEEECAENGNEKEGSAEEDDSDEDGPQLPSGLTGRHGTTRFMINTVCNVSYMLSVVYFV